MEQKEFDAEKLITYWIDSSDDDFDTMSAMFEAKRYSWSLFVGHLMIEKLLKALYVKVHGGFPPLIHNLLSLAEQCGVSLSDEQKTALATITAFNINARYDDYKSSFQKRCTPEFTGEWIEKIKLNRQWIKQLIIK